jgi:TRAP-type mannitol/chloroaromatic compound transport system permease small subunit
MPSLTFVLPHWMYWSGLLLFPLIALYMASRPAARDALGRPTLGVGYLTLITAGFVGLHRFYVRSAWGLAYLVPFFGIIVANIQGRAARLDLSKADNDRLGAAFKIETLEAQVAAGKEGAATRLEEARAALASIEGQVSEAAASVSTWDTVALGLAIVIALLLLIDAILLPRLVRRCAEREAATGEATGPGAAGSASAESVGYAHLSGLTYAIARLSDLSGQYVAMWSVLAVFVYYYEVVARYMFNSPTNWAHESMFLMFGMQYLISGAYAYLNESHVRVDVFYARLSRRGKALSDVLTSVFFFIFAGTLLVTGWIFMMDAIQVWEVSFTEWAIQYWPVKIAITLGAALILLQGAAKLLADLHVLHGGGH